MTRPYLSLIHIFCEPPEEAEIRDSQFIMRELLLHRGDCSFCTRLTHRSLFENRRFPEGELNEDFYLLVQMLPEVPGIAVLPQQDYHVFYRYGSNTRTHDENYFPPVFTDIVRNAEDVYKRQGTERSAIYYGNVYERVTGQLVSSNPKLNAFGCYRNVPCHQRCV